MVYNLIFGTFQLARTVVGDIDRRFDSLSGSHDQSPVNCIYVSGQLSRDVIGCFKSNRWLSRYVVGCYWLNEPTANNITS